MLVIVVIFAELGGAKKFGFSSHQMKGRAKAIKKGNLYGGHKNYPGS